MSMRWILLVLISFCWTGCGEATVRPFLESADAGVDGGDDDDDDGIDEDGIDVDDGGIDEDGIDVDDGGIDDE